MNHDERQLIQHILQTTRKGNIDNISRTNCYESFYFRYQEIKWAFLAGLVSRNAGWNMCDLEGKSYSSLLTKQYRSYLFLTYERDNWLIFQDAYPQLLLYHYSTKIGRPLFHLLPYFHVSAFMQQEWFRFWQTGNENRLLYSLIINEQNLIQEPIISKLFYQKKVFQTVPFYLQELFHFNAVIFPTCYGEIFGATVKKFVKLDQRIELGKKLAWILFEMGRLQTFIDFAIHTPHTGSRYDYEKFWLKKRNTPMLRLTYPIVKQEPLTGISWDKKQRVKKRWFLPPIIKEEEVNMTYWLRKKHIEIELLVNLKEWMRWNE